MFNPWDAIKDKLEEWGERLERRIIVRVMRIVADVLEAHPTTPEILRRKADHLEGGGKL
jgi:hypothetical protein